MTELIKARDTIKEFWVNQWQIHDEYQLNNEQYLDGLADALKIMEKIINGEIGRMADYYEADNK